MLNGLDLFSGIGGITLALSEWVKPIAYCEIDRYCQSVLLSRMVEQAIQQAPIWDDIKTFPSSEFMGHVDIIYGGFPCQDISIAGHGKGLEGERSGLFFEIVRLCREIKPRFIFLENVPAITTRGGTEVVRQITALGYDCRWCVISAASIGALHKRERFFLLAHTPSTSTNGHTKRKKKTHSLPRNCRKNVHEFCNINSKSSIQTHKETKSQQTEKETWRGSSRQCWPFESREYWQKTVSEMGKLSDGIPYHMDRLRALGNAVVPQQAKEAFKILMGI